MSSRKEQKARLREERLAREREAQAAERRRKTVGYAVGGALVGAAVIAIVVVILAGGGDSGTAGGSKGGSWPSGSVPGQKTDDLAAAARAAGCETKDHREEGRSHVDEGKLEYGTNPPTSGDHRSIPAEDGAYTESPETEASVHSLEHGRVIIQFKPDAPPEVRGNLKALFDEDSAHMVLMPNASGMPFQVAATAWTHSLTCPSYNDRVPDAIRSFILQYRDRGPEFAP
jgi:hypothetical protein